MTSLRRPEQNSTGGNRFRLPALLNNFGWRNRVHVLTSLCIFAETADAAATSWSAHSDPPPAAASSFASSTTPGSLPSTAPPRQIGQKPSLADSIAQAQLVAATRQQWADYTAASPGFWSEPCPCGSSDQAWASAAALGEDSCYFTHHASGFPGPFPVLAAAPYRPHPGSFTPVDGVCASTSQPLQFDQVFPGQQPAGYVSVPFLVPIDHHCEQVKRKGKREPPRWNQRSQSYMWQLREERRSGNMAHHGEQKHAARTQCQEGGQSPAVAGAKVCGSSSFGEGPKDQQKPEHRPLFNAHEIEKSTAFLHEIYQGLLDLEYGGKPQPPVDVECVLSLLKSVAPRSQSSSHRTTPVQAQTRSALKCSLQKVLEEQGLGTLLERTFAREQEGQRGSYSCCLSGGSSSSTTKPSGAKMEVPQLERKTNYTRPKTPLLANADNNYKKESDTERCARLRLSRASPASASTCTSATQSRRNSGDSVGCAALAGSTPTPTTATTLTSTGTDSAASTPFLTRRMQRENSFSSSCSTVSLAAGGDASRSSPVLANKTTVKNQRGASPQNCWADLEDSDKELGGPGVEQDSDADSRSEPAQSGSKAPAPFACIFRTVQDQEQLPDAEYEQRGEAAPAGAAPADADKNAGPSLATCAVRPMKSWADEEEECPWARQRSSGGQLSSFASCVHHLCEPADGVDKQGHEEPTPVAFEDGRMDMEMSWTCSSLCRDKRDELQKVHELQDRLTAHDSTGTVQPKTVLMNHREDVDGLTDEFSERAIVKKNIGISFLDGGSSEDEDMHSLVGDVQKFRLSDAPFGTTTVNQYHAALAHTRQKNFNGKRGPVGKGSRDWHTRSTSAYQSATVPWSAESQPSSGGWRDATRGCWGGKNKKGGEKSKGKGAGANSWLDSSGKLWQPTLHHW
ncbi:unnamed protein product [Amoebophrya sp. A120]|nr:unnamed protein product [Amoebophrya sp. A120]|eukprot:GSA120T00004030001.1